MIILESLENEYQIIQQRKLTLDHLGEVIIDPRYPDQGEDMDYDLNLSPSHYLRNSLELLRRTKGMTDRVIKNRKKTIYSIEEVVKKNVKPRVGEKYKIKKYRNLC